MINTMYTPLKADFFARNRKRLKKKLAEKLPIIIAGNGLLQRTSDNAYSFTQDSNFWYLTGIDIPDMVLVIDVHETFVIVPDRSVSREAFDGKIDALALETRSGITAVYNEADGWPDDGIAPGTLWQDVPEDWLCPDCGVGKMDFEMIEIN